MDDPKKDLIKTTDAVVSFGCEGRIVGRQLWGRPIQKMLDLNRQIIDVMRKPEYHRADEKAWS